MDFVATQNFKSPYVLATGKPHQPTAIKVLQFKKGDVIVGELKRDKEGKPAYILHKGIVVIPLNCVRQVLTKEINMSAVDGEKITMKVNATTPSAEKKKMYMDSVIVGGILGFAVTYYAEKKGYIAVASQKNKVIGAIIGGLAGAYLVYRFKSK
jgi:hypothetical protein